MKEHKREKFYLFLVLSLSLGIGCATTEKQPLSMEMYEKYQTIQKLEESLLAAKGNEVNVFAPKGFDLAQTLLDQSTDMVREGAGDQAIRADRQPCQPLRRDHPGQRTATGAGGAQEARCSHSRSIQSGAPLQQGELQQRTLALQIPADVRYHQWH